jgi:hypothetical protein
MPSTIRSILSTCVAIGSLAAALNVGVALAGVSNRRVLLHLLRLGALCEAVRFPWK